jgi:hypothetical protein
MHFDMANRQKSWIGRPSVNTCNYNFYNYVDSNATLTRNAIPPIAPPVTGYEVFKLQSNNGANTDMTILYNSAVDQVNGGVYTHSAWILLTAGTYCKVGQHWNPWDAGPAQYIPANEWTRVSYTLTNNTNNYGNIANAYGTNGTIYITAVQYEAGSTMTPFMGGAGSSRSNTQAILDLTGKNTITATSLTYNSDGTFSFNGSNNYLETANNIITGNSPFTFECFYTLSGQTGGEIFGNYGSGYSSANYIWISGQYGLYIGGAVYFPGAPIANGTYHMACSRDTSGNCVLYKNGVQVNSGTLTGSIVAGPNFRIGIDTGGTGEPFSGKIYSQRLYNRVLSANEVAQNFNAQRGIYGL